MNIDYHIAFHSNFYSVPYNLVHELGRSSSHTLRSDHIPGIEQFAGVQAVEAALPLPTFPPVLE